MKNLTLEAIARACGGVYAGDEAKKELCVTAITVFPFVLFLIYSEVFKMFSLSIPLKGSSKMKTSPL